MTSENETVLANIANLKTQISSLEKLLEPLLNQPLSQLSSQLTPLDAAKLHAAVAYSLSTLEVCYLKLHGIDHQSHNIMTDLQKVRESMGKITATSKMLETIAAEQASGNNDSTTTTTSTTTNNNDNTMNDNPSNKNPNIAPGKAKKRKA